MKDEPTRKKLLVELMYITRPTIVLRRVGRIELLRAAVLEMVPEVRFLPHASGKLTIVVSDAESYENAYAVVTGVVVDFARS